MNRIFFLLLEEETSSLTLLPSFPKWGWMDSFVITLKPWDT